ncbi:hypothetical protein K1X76_09350 [bacterium]|nr:hypothetical protein [bacterium]
MMENKKASLLSLLSRSAKVAAPVGAIGGFIGDVLAPIAPFAGILFWIVFCGWIVSGAIWFLKVRKTIEAARADGKITDEEYKTIFQTNKWSVLFAFTTVATPILLIIMLLGKAHPDTGFVAGTIPGMDKLQQSILGIEKDVGEIKETTKNIDAKTNQIINKLDNIAESFENLKSNSGLIPNPQTPQEYYHNARMYERDANYPLARQAYQAYLKFGLDFIDPHLTYQMMLKMQDGIEATREIYQNLSSQNPDDKVLKLVTILLWDKELRLQKLEALYQESPDFAPVCYMLSKEYSEEKLGTQGIADKQKEKQYLECFTKLDSEGKFLKYFLDKGEAEKWKNDAETRLNKLAQAPQNILNNPVSIMKFSSEDGLAITLVMADPNVKEIFYRLEENPDFKSTGFLDMVSPVTGLPIPKTQLSMNLKEAVNTTLYIKYRDTRDQELGPYSFPIESKRGDIEQMQLIMKNVPDWIEFETDDGQFKIMFQKLLAVYTAVKEVKYSINSSALDKKLPLTPGATEITKIEEFTVIPTVPVQSVTVQVVFADGSTSETRTFTP